MSFAESRPSRPSRVDMLTGEASHLLGRGGRGSFRVGKDNVLIARGLGGDTSLEVSLVDVSPRSDHRYPGRTARIIDIASKHPKVVEVTHIFKPDKSGRLQPAEGEPISTQDLPDVDERYVEPVAFLASIKEVASSVSFARSDLLRLSLDKFGRTREEADLEKKNAKDFDDQAQELITLAVNERAAKQIDSKVYVNQGGGSSSVPLYQARYYPVLGGDIEQFDGIDDIVITQTQQVRGFLGRKIVHKVTVNYTDRDQPQFLYHTGKGRILESTYIGKQLFGVTPLRVDAGDRLLHILGSLDERHLRT